MIRGKTNDSLNVKKDLVYTINIFISKSKLFNASMFWESLQGAGGKSVAIHKTKHMQDPSLPGVVDRYFNTVFHFQSNYSEYFIIQIVDF